MEHPSAQTLIHDAVNGYIFKKFEEKSEAYRIAGLDTAELERLRIILTYGGAPTPFARASRSARALYKEWPYAKHVLLASGAIVIGAALFVLRGPFRQMAVGIAYAGRNIPRHFNAWLRPSPRSATLYSPAPAAAPAPAPGVPLYYTMRYPNQAYRIAGYCFAAFWIVLLGPLALALLLPACTLLAGFQHVGFSERL